LHEWYVARRPSLVATLGATRELRLEKMLREMMRMTQPQCFVDVGFRFLYGAGFGCEYVCDEQMVIVQLLWKHQVARLQ
jgi:hypothetical protein